MGELSPDSAQRHTLSALWSARSVAVIGASDRPGALGRLPIEFLQRYGYAGRILPVRPDGGSVCGLPSRASVAEWGEPVDLAMIMVAAARVPEAVADCVAAGVPVAIVCTSGFAETGSEGAALQSSVVAAARAGGLRVVGPNCIGTVGVGSGQVTSFSPLFSGAETRLVPGSIGFVSQSGALGYGAVSLAFERGLGLGWVVNTGNEADVSAVEVMAAMASEPSCRGVLGYVESLNDMVALRALAGSGVPVALMKAGRSEAGARAAASHTGALATGDRVIDAALRQLAIVRADDVEELLDLGEVMTATRTRGRRVAVVTTSGGSGILAADALESRGLSLAPLSASTTAALDEIVPAFGSTANPVDVTATVMSNASLFDRTLDVIADDPSVDAILATFCVLTGKDVDDVVTSLERVAKRSGKPVVVARTGADHLAPDATARMRAAGIPSYPTPARAVRALAALATWSSLAPPSPLPTSPLPPASPLPPNAAFGAELTGMPLSSLTDSEFDPSPAGAEATSSAHSTQGSAPHSVEWAETAGARASSSAHSTGVVGAEIEHSTQGEVECSGSALPAGAKSEHSTEGAPEPHVEWAETAGPGATSSAHSTEGATGSAHSTEGFPRVGASEQEVKGLLASHGIRVPAGRLATSAEDAVAAVEESGGRAVFKAVVPGLVHKSDAGGVIVGVTPPQAPDAFDKVAALGGRVWVEEMVSGGVEALVGLSPSPLGTVLTVGVGGVLTEVMADVALRILPVTRDDVEQMVDETRLSTLMAGVRGAPPADRTALVDTVLRLAAVVATWPEGFELDLNPVTVLPDGQGVRVLDAAYVAPKEPA